MDTLVEKEEECWVEKQMFWEKRLIDSEMWIYEEESYVLAEKNTQKDET